MNQFLKILKFELKSYMANKVFWGVTVFIMAVIIGVLFFPRIADTFKSDNQSETDIRGNIMLVSAENGDEQLKAAFSEAFSDYKVVFTDDSEEEIQAKIKDQTAGCAFILNSSTDYTYYVNNLSMYDINTSVADEILKSVFRMNVMTESGISPERAAEIMSMEISHKLITIGENQIQNFIYTYIMVIALYMVILLYGQMVATNVATEKSSRAMELLITSAKPASMMFGKVMASCAAGLVQITAIFGTAFLCYNINKEQWANNEIIASIFNIPASIFAFMLVFFLLGFLIYAFLYGAVGSTVSKLEDINTAVMPITMLFIIAFFVVVFSMSSGNVENTLMKVCSFIPFTSPVAMFTRIAMSTVPAYEIAISVVILIASVIGTGYISAKIYRAGVLLYGTAPKISTIVNLLKKSS